MSLTLTRRYNVDRFDYLIPHRYGNLPMVGAVATYRPGEGRFGGAVAVEEGTENLATNPFFQGGKSGWESTFQSGLSAWNVTEEVSWQGGKSLVFEGTGNHLWRSFGQTIGPFAAGESITIQYVHKVIGHLEYPLILRLVGASADSTPLHTRSIGEWMLSSSTFTFRTNTERFQFEFRTSEGNAPGTRIYLGGVQVEKKPFATSFVDGSRGSGTVDIPVQYTPEGTLSFWAKLPYSLPAEFGDSDIMMSTAHDGGYGSSSSLNFRRYGASFNNRLLGIHWGGKDGSRNHINPTWYEGILYHQADWNLYTITWTPNRYDFYINGVRIGGSSSSSGLKPFESNRLRIRGDYSLYDELLILPYAASEEEIVSWYEAQGPLPPHPQAALQWDWQAVRPAQMVKL